MVIAAGLCWASGNHMARTIDKDHVLGLTIWACLFATPLLGISALLIEGLGVIERSLASASVGAWFAVVWQSVGNTLFGYGLWAWLLSRHPAATVAPLAMLVPVFGIGTAGTSATTRRRPTNCVARNAASPSKSSTSCTHGRGLPVDPEVATVIRPSPATCACITQSSQAPTVCGGVSLNKLSSRSNASASALSAPSCSMESRPSPLSPICIEVGHSPSAAPEWFVPR